MLNPFKISLDMVLPALNREILSQCSAHCHTNEISNNAIYFHCFLEDFLYCFVALTTWACVSPKVATLIMAAMMVLIFVCFYFIDNSETKCTSSLSDDLSGVHYSALETNGMFGV